MEIRDEIGAHVSVAGGVDRAPARAREIGAHVLQLFTKQAQRWLEPELAEARVADFRAERSDKEIGVAAAHDSYLINLASPNPTLRARSIECFVGELRRSTALGLDYVVTHPGNATDGDVASGIARNAEGIGLAFEAVHGPTMVLLELTAGAGSSLGGTFEQLAGILDAVPASLRARVGVCVDSCHAFVGGYDLIGDFDGVWRRFDDMLGRERLRLLHLNDSKSPFGSRWDRHAHIGEGAIGLEPFRRFVTDDRFRGIPKLLETPKEPDPVAMDRKNLATLRRLRREAEGAPSGKR